MDDIINRNGVDEQAVIQAVAEGLERFYTSLIAGIDKIDIKRIMSKKNPYLYRAKAMSSASEIMETVLSAYVSSSEETIFGNVFFEPVAVVASGGVKALAEGIDIMVDDRERHTMYAIAVKSGTSVFNADSKRRQEQNFNAASKLAQQARAYYNAIIGYGYGRKATTGKGQAKIYEEMAGQAFWEKLTGDPDFYIELIGYMGTLPEQYLEDYKTAYNKALNRLVRDFSTMFCKADGAIDWEKLVRYNSGKEKPGRDFFNKK